MSHCGLHCLKIEDIGVSTDGKTLLEHVNIHAHCGQITAIIGRNGAGKSTLFKAILGEIKHSGTLQFSGHSGAVTARRPRMGYVPQKLELDSASPLTVFDMMAAFTSSYPVFLPRRKKTVETVKAQLQKFQAEHLIDQPVGRLSGGEQQRVLLALATLPVPDVLLLDEPEAGVDRAGLTDFYPLLQELKVKEDMVILLVSHDLDYVKQHADRVVLLDKTVLAAGTPNEVFATAAFREMFEEVGA